MGDLAEASKDSLSPIFVVPPIDWDFEEDKPKKTLAEHLSKLPEQLQKAWGNREFFLDLLHIDDENGAPGASGHPLTWIESAAVAAGCGAITFVTAPDRNPAGKSALATVLGDAQRDVAIRLSPNNWTTVAGTTLLSSLLADLGVDAPRVHLILDMGDEILSGYVGVLVHEIQSLAMLGEWKSVIVAGTGIPRDNPSGAGLHIIPRTELAVYQDTVKRLPPASREIVFSDYVISGPGLVLDIDPRVMSISAMFRYAASQHWVFAKGGLFKGPRSTGAKSMQDPAAKLQADSDFTPGHCASEGWISNVASGSASGGNTSVWRRYGTLHHLEFTLAQAAKRFVP